ncbi:MAG TPA: CRISPR-associated ring nuclease Csm6, partial [Acidobacteriota bacterium]|nr:CRISPR-associated ring nuclease Csm6 [Acidobacteriota bacterium]
MSKRKKVLLCVTGMTPQIVTETLYVLMVERAEWIDEIRVMTTLDGRNQLLSTLLAPDTGQFFAFCREFGFDSGRMKFDETTIWLLRSSDSMLRDIRTESDNVQAGNQICELVRTLTTDPETMLYASVAGGRKTMGIFLTAAMQLFGRVQDRLSHVLVSEDFETHPDFYYLPSQPKELEITDRFGTVIKRVSTQDARIYLADIPFIRLRGLLANWQPEIVKYSDLVARAQEDLDLVESTYEIHIWLCTGRRGWTVSIANRSARLTEREVFVYALLIEAGARHLGPIAVEEITESLIDATLNRLFTTR